jgi:hypothetical protein
LLASIRPDQRGAVFGLTIEQDQGIGMLPS